MVLFRGLLSSNWTGVSARRDLRPTHPNLTNQSSPDYAGALARRHAWSRSCPVSLVIEHSWLSSNKTALAATGRKIDFLRPPRAEEQ